MLNGNFSQLPVYDHKECVALLTSETIARWIAAKFQPDLNILEEASVEQVLKYRETGSAHLFVSRRTPIAEVVAQFDATAHGGKSLDAVIVTQDGNSNEKPLRIETVYDLPLLFRKSGLDLG